MKYSDINRINSVKGFTTILNEYNSLNDRIGEISRKPLAKRSTQERQWHFALMESRQELVDLIDDFLARQGLSQEEIWQAGLNRYVEIAGKLATA